MFHVHSFLNICLLTFALIACLGRLGRQCAALATYDFSMMLFLAQCLCREWKSAGATVRNWHAHGGSHEDGRRLSVLQLVAVSPHCMFAGLCSLWFMTKCLSNACSFLFIVCSCLFSFQRQVALYFCCVLLEHGGEDEEKPLQEQFWVHKFSNSLVETTVRWNGCWS